MKRHDRPRALQAPHCLALLDRPAPTINAPHAAEVRWLPRSGSMPPPLKPRLSAAAAVMEIRRDGMLLLADDSPPAGTKVVVRLPRLMPGLWITAVVVAARRMRVGPVELKLAFSTKPPGYFFAATADDSAAIN